MTLLSYTLFLLSCLGSRCLDREREPFSRGNLLTQTRTVAPMRLGARPSEYKVCLLGHLVIGTSTVCGGRWDPEACMKCNHH